MDPRSPQTHACQGVETPTLETLPDHKPNRDERKHSAALLHSCLHPSPTPDMSPRPLPHTTTYALFIWLSVCSVVFVPSSHASSKVELALYYETLCPYCSNFMVNYLPEIFRNHLIDVIDLKLLPYGNAKLGPPDNTITCQHGPFECLLNDVEGCAIHVWPDLKKHYTFIYCVERLVFEGKYTEWESCFGVTGFDSKPIEDCYKSGLGKQLQLQYAKETNSIQPPHRYVPWVTVNGKPLYEDYRNFTSYICEAYKGSTVPKACNNLPSQIDSTMKSNQMNQVSYVMDTTSSSSPDETSTNIRSAVSSWRRQMKMAS